MQKRYDEFLESIQEFRTKYENIPDHLRVKYGVDDSEFRSAMQDHVMNTIQNMTVDQSRYWGLYQHVPGVENMNKYLSDAFFNLGYHILDGYRLYRGKQNAKILQYLQDNDYLRYTF